MIKWEWPIIEDWKAIAYFGPVVSSFIGMFVAMGLDTLTPTPTAVWVAVWVFMALAPLVGTLGARALHAYRGMSTKQIRAARAYDALSDDDKARLPANILETIRQSSDAQAGVIASRIDILREKSSLPVRNHVEIVIEQIDNEIKALEG